MIAIKNPYNGWTVRLDARLVTRDKLEEFKSAADQKIVYLIEQRYGYELNAVEFMRHYVELAGPVAAGACWFKSSN